MEETEPELSVMRESIDVLRKSDVKVGGREGGRERGREGRGGEREEGGGGREGGREGGKGGERGRKGGGREGGKREGGREIHVHPSMVDILSYFGQLSICQLSFLKVYVPSNGHVALISLPVKYHVHVYMLICTAKPECKCKLPSPPRLYSEVARIARTCS